MTLKDRYNQIFTDVATAIRTKTGGTEKYTPATLATGVSNIPVGEGGGGNPAQVNPDIFPLGLQITEGKRSTGSSGGIYKYDTIELLTLIEREPGAMDKNSLTLAADKTPTGMDGRLVILDSTRTEMPKLQFCGIQGKLSAVDMSNAPIATISENAVFEASASIMVKNMNFEALTKIESRGLYGNAGGRFVDDNWDNVDDLVFPALTTIGSEGFCASAKTLSLPVLTSMTYGSLRRVKVDSITIGSPGHPAPIVKNSVFVGSTIDNAIIYTATGEEDPSETVNRMGLPTATQLEFRKA